MDRSVYRANLTALKKYFDALSERGLSREKLCFLPVATASALLREKLPQNAPIFDEFEVLAAAKEELEGYTLIDPSAAVGALETPFYKTDHHWTTDAAYAAYVLWCEATGREARALEEYNIITASDSFRGTLYSKVLASGRRV